MDSIQDSYQDNSPDNIPDYLNTPKGIPLQRLIDLRSKGLSYNDIAAVVGCAKSNVIQRLADYKDEIEALPEFKKNRADLLAVHQSKILNSLTTSDINKASLVQRTTAFCQLYDKERLERGHSTSNIAIDQVIESREEAEQRRQEIADKRAALEAELQGLA